MGHESDIRSFQLGGGNNSSIHNGYGSIKNDNNAIISNNINSLSEINQDFELAAKSKESSMLSRVFEDFDNEFSFLQEALNQLDQ